ncbi:MAG: DUF3343 domain-containing protein [Oscillospiraceae bacterium]|nr:DUF3343 domain-containing protein [Oscillospiraceae bacterium]
MTQYLIMCRSLTYAQSAARLLESAGLTAAVIKSPQKLSSGGCGYAVSLHGRFDEAVSLLKKKSLLTGKLYRRLSDGEYTEVRP